MAVDTANVISRLRRVLPTRWFSDGAPLADAVLAGIGSAHVAIYNLVQAVAAQTRLASATSVFLDMFGADYFGVSLPRRAGESDLSFRVRISGELLRARCTRLALTNTITALTGRPVVVFEPARPGDTGGYSQGGVGYCVAGGWGNLDLSFQSFVTAGRPRGGGIRLLAGYGTGGPLCYGNLAQVTTTVTDADIYAAAAASMPIGYTAWVQIHD